MDPDQAQEGSENGRVHLANLAEERQIAEISDSSCLKA